MICKKCGANVPDGNKFCAECGNSTFESDRKCRACNRPMGPDDGFCRACGAPANAESVPKTASVCQKCSSPVNPTDRFCPTCGVSVSVETPFVQPTYIQPSFTSARPMRNDEGVFGFLNRTFSSVEYLVACILFTVGLFCQFILLDNEELFEVSGYFVLWYVMPVIAAIFMWILYAVAHNGTIHINKVPLKALDIVTKIQWIISWVLVGTLLVMGLICQLSYSALKSEDLDYDTYNNLISLSKFVLKVFMISALAGPLHNLIAIVDIIWIFSLFSDEDSKILDGLLSSTMNVGKYAFVTFAGFAVVIAIINLCTLGKMRKVVSSLTYSADCGKNYIDGLGASINSLFFIAGVYILMIITAEFNVEPLIIFGCYSGFVITMGIVLGKLKREAKCF